MCAWKRGSDERRKRRDAPESIVGVLRSMEQVENAASLANASTGVETVLDSGRRTTLPFDPLFRFW
jgi:hypothetical protein